MVKNFVVISGGSTKSQETILVLADGLGSGLKLTFFLLTTKIAATMLRRVSIEETSSYNNGNITHMQVRKIAYSTFTIIRVDCVGNCYIVEYGNPPVILLEEVL